MGRPLNSHSAIVRLTISAVILWSHGGGLISYGLLSVSTTNLPSNMQEALIHPRNAEMSLFGNNEGPRMPNHTCTAYHRINYSAARVLGQKIMQHCVDWCVEGNRWRYHWQHPHLTADFSYKLRGQVARNIDISIPTTSCKHPNLWEISLHDNTK